MIKYLGSAGGSNPDQSRGYFLTSVRDTISDDEIEQQWGGVLWAGVIDNAQPLDGKFDRFYLKFRAFSGDGTTDNHDFSDGFVTDWKIQFRMAQDPDDDDDPKIAKILDLRETHVERNQHYPRIRATTDTEAYTLPTTESDPTGAIDWRTGKPAPDLCYTAVPLGSENYWFRTRLGWVNGSDFKIEEEQGLTRECPRVASRRAKAMNASATGTR